MTTDDLTVPLRYHLDSIRHTAELLRDTDKHVTNLHGGFVEKLLALRLHYDTVITAMSQRHAEREAEWIKEKFDLHNNLLNKWQEMSEKDRQRYATSSDLTALREAFDVANKAMTALIATAEGKKSGIGDIKGAINFILGLAVVGLAVWAALK